MMLAGWQWQGGHEAGPPSGQAMRVPVPGQVTQCRRWVR
jgi:hypothetical protein